MRVMIFDHLPDGRAVHRVQIESDRLRVGILTLGAALQEVRLPGLDRNLTLGFSSVGPYLRSFPHAGTIMGPVANRIAGAEAEIDGRTHRFDKNFLDAHTLHGGSAATHSQLWSLRDADVSSATLTLDLPDGAGGFPGNRHLTVTYAVDGPALTLTLTAKTDAPTLMNLANHSYWNLGPGATTKGHRLAIPATHYLPSPPDTVIPTGEVAQVDGTRFDYRKGREIAAGSEGLLDNNFCLANARQPLRAIAMLTAPDGTSMDMASTEPGLQVFDGHILGAEAAATTDGRTTQAYAALALEAQFWPNAPHYPDFPDITLRPEDDWKQVTRWSFAASSR